MPILEKSSWRKHEAELTRFPDFVSFFPQEGIVISYTWARQDDERYHVWGCWYVEIEGKVVYTALPKSENWRKESYILNSKILEWHTKSGSARWEEIDAGDIPEGLRNRGFDCFRKLQNSKPPPKIWRTRRAS